jgi:hypothetical protein
MARRVGSLRAQLEAGEDLAGTLRVSGSWREAVAVADEVRVDVASLELAGPPRLLGELVMPWRFAMTALARWRSRKSS